jgi:hypothetical protein
VEREEEGEESRISDGRMYLKMLVGRERLKARGTNHGNGVNHGRKEWKV